MDLEALNLMSVSFIIFSSAVISSNHWLLLNLGTPYFMLMLKSTWIYAFQHWDTLTSIIMQLVYSTVMKNASRRRLKMSSICKTNELRGWVKDS